MAREEVVLVWKSVAPKSGNVLRLVGWNALLFIGGLTLIVAAWEAWLRLTVPFMDTFESRVFVPGVGDLYAPNSEVRFTNRLDFWAVSKSNDWGFLDRQPPDPRQTAKDCHITMIGDSFVEAREVDIPDKFHVQLETLANRQLPHLNITTSAFGRGNTGQINQLPYYDQYARRLHPDLLVLVAVQNDFLDNSLVLSALFNGWHPDKMPFVFAVKDANGTISLQPPHPGFETDELYQRHRSKIRPVILRSTFVGNRLSDRVRPVFNLFAVHIFQKTDSLLIETVERMSRHPRYASFSRDWNPVKPTRLWWSHFLQRPPPSIFGEALDLTYFGLKEFKRRASRDNVSLVILATYTLSSGFLERGENIRWFNLLKRMAEMNEIPVIDQYDFILRQGGKIGDVHWPHDGHWNPIGHQWAAESLLEYLRQHPEICDKPRTKDPA